MFSNTSAEISLNTPSKCITSILNDKRNHRFLVGTCAQVPTSQTHNLQNDYMDSMDNMDMNNDNAAPLNPLYLLRYHEDMNELALDAQLDFGQDGGNGEVWCLSSCPMDATLVVANRSSITTRGNSGDDLYGVDGDIGAETAIWRIPSAAMREDDIDYYGDDDGYDGGAGQGLERDNYKTMEKIATLSPGMTMVTDDSSNSSSTRNALKGRISDMKWNPESISDESDDFSGGGAGAGGINFLTVDHSIDTPTLTTWDIGTSSAIPVDRISIPNANNDRLGALQMIVPSPPKASWDPHNTHLCAVTSGTNVAIVDLRSSSHLVCGLKACHKFGVTDLDHNPNKPNVLSTCGQDALVKFWDLRYTSSASSSFDDSNAGSSGSGSWARQRPLRILRGGHTHWTNSVKYNSFHDQLLLSGGSDGMVNLWRASSISSAPLLDLTAEGNEFSELGTGYSGLDDADDDNQGKIHVRMEGEPLSSGPNFNNIGSSGAGADADASSVNTDGGNAPDVRVAKMEMREAVYDLAWSAADPWVYVTLAYDGNVVLNHVPSKEKYKILL